MGTVGILFVAALALVCPISELAGTLYLQKYNPQVMHLLKTYRRARILLALLQTLSMVLMFAMVSYKLCPSGVFAMECLASAAIIFVTNFFGVLVSIRLVK